MAERVSVERVLGEAHLEEGLIALGPTEAERLGMPRHSEHMRLYADGEVVDCHYDAVRRQLSGEDLQDYLAGSAKIGDLVRLSRLDDAPLELTVGGAASVLSTSALRSRSGASALLAPGGTVAKPVAAAHRRPRAGGSDRYRLRSPEEYLWHERVGHLKAANRHFEQALKSGGWDDAASVGLRLEGEKLATLDHFDELLAIDVSNIDHMPHQEAAARVVLSRMNGRGILADEVGLGKTVEGGLVIKELLLRGLVERILIICPSQLREQWREELKTKFDEDFEVLVSGQDARALRRDRLIMTLELARTNFDRFGAPFDLVIIDEAHRLSSGGARTTRKRISSLIKDVPRVLFLTATPVQNNLLELYRLVELLRPGTFRSEKDFTRRYVDTSDPRKPVNAAALRQLVRSVMIRTTRAQAGLDKVRRLPPQDHGIVLTPPERTLYDLIVTTLREHMNDPGDTMRRRQLALSLTASPYRVMKTAMRMEQTHPHPATRELLGRIADLAAGIKFTAREQTALGVIKPWLVEHGSVLVFTQHTETMHALKVLLEGEGIATAVFHGGMAQKARAVAISDFQSMRAQVLVSTDAGAEGQNLQFCNCVMNYDLPWNPMRVEQRIGRVHRLTQERDIHISNLFARETIDEQVYRLLHDKLAMFELLFGQVVTILGELEGTQDKTVEARVLEALYARSDQGMQNRLDELGSQLEHARRSAEAMMVPDSGLSHWLAETSKARQERTAAPQASELVPESSERSGTRQKSLAALVNRFMDAMNCEISYATDDFISVTLSDAAVRELGRAEMHLAFSQAALRIHPEAELCVVGSEVFDDILLAMRSFGDLVGTVAVIPEVSQDTLIDHVPEVRLLERTVRAGQDWSAKATYRIQHDAAGGTQQVAEVVIGELPDGQAQSRLALSPGSPVPVAGEDVLEEVTRRASEYLEGELSKAVELQRQQQLDSHAQLLGNLQAQMHDEQQRLTELQELPAYARSRAHQTRVSEAQEAVKRAQQTLRTLQKAVEPADTAQLRSELLALEVHGSADLRVSERWQHSNGSTGEVTYPWTGTLAGRAVPCAASGDIVRVLALCAQAHVVDAKSLLHCDVCGDDGCAACGAGRALATCRVCERQACSRCRVDGLCTGCAVPERATELDGPDVLGWRLGGRTTLRVGRRHAVLTREAGEPVTVLPDESAHDDAHRRLRLLAARLGLSPSAGLGMAGSFGEPGDLVAGALWSKTMTDVWWHRRADGTGDVHRPVLDLLPQLPDEANPDVAETETGTGLEQTLVKLRRQVPPPASEQLTAVPFTVAHRIDIEGEQLVHREFWRDGAGDPVLARETRGVPKSQSFPVPVGYRPVTRMRLGDIDLEVVGLHRSYLIATTEGESVFVPGFAEATHAQERLVAASIAEAGLSPDHQAVELPDVVSEEPVQGYAQAAPGTHVRRTHVEIKMLVALADTGTSSIGPDGQSPQAAFLAELDVPLVPVARVDCQMISEHWHSERGRTSCEYLRAPGVPVDPRVLEGRLLLGPDDPVLPLLPDGSVATVPLAVDIQGHLHDPSSVSQCPVCAEIYCPACPDHILDVCGTCERRACSSCLHEKHESIEAADCQRCGDRSCGDCGRSLRVADCGLCERRVCAASLQGGVCQTCAALNPATSDEIAALPGELEAKEMGVLIARDSSVTLVVLYGPHRQELAWIVDGRLERWITAANDTPLELAARFKLAAMSGSGNVSMYFVPSPEPPDLADEFVISSDVSTEMLWAVSIGGRHVAGSQDVPEAEAGSEQAVPEEYLRGFLGGTAPRILPSEAGSWQAELIRACTGQLPLYARPAVARLFRRSRFRALTVTVDGLCRREYAGAADSSELAPWEAPDVPPSWAGEGWLPVPWIPRIATKEEFSAAIACMGGHAMLGVRAGDGTVSWASLNEQRADLARALLGRVRSVRDQVGQHGTGLIAVRRYTAPGTTQGLRIVGGHRTSQDLAPTWLESIPDYAHNEHTLDVLHALQPGLQPQAPPQTPAGAVPEALGRQLLERFAGDPGQAAWFDVGLMVREEWTLSSGVLPVHYEVGAGFTNGCVPDAVTGLPIQEVNVCRSGHLVSQIAQCVYCLSTTCLACPGSVRECPICAIAVCGKCGPIGFCMACVNLKQVGLLNRALSGSPRGATVWRGDDRSGQVTVTRHENYWYVKRMRGGRTFDVPVDGPRMRAIASRVDGGALPGGWGR